MTKLAKILLLTVPVILIVGLLLAFTARNQKKQADNQTNQQMGADDQGNSEIVDNTQNQQEPELITSDIDTSDWLTYRNEELGFSFRYPEDWKYVRKGINFVNMHPSDEKPVHRPRVQIKVWNNPKKTALIDFYGRLEESKKIDGNDSLIYNWYGLSSKIKAITIDGRSAVNFISPTGIVENTTVAIPVDQRILEINFSYIEEITPKTIEGEIVNSLKFIDTSDWRTYHSEELEMSFQNPGNFYLLDRLDEREKSILISDEVIEYNEFLAGYFAPISISRFRKEQDNVIKSFANKEERAIMVGGEKAIMIDGTMPEQPPYGEFRTLMVIVDSRDIMIRMSEVRSFAGGKISFELDTVVNKLLSTIVFQ